MKSYVYTYKLPFTLEQFNIGCNYAHAQSVKSYNKATEQPIIAIESQKIEDRKITTVTNYNLRNYPSKMVQKLIPENCDMIHEVTISLFPWNEHRYTVPKRPDALTAVLSTHIEEQRVMPADFAAFNPKERYADLCGDGYDGPVIYAYKMF